jgi:hypothetical protein
MELSRKDHHTLDPQVSEDKSIIYGEPDLSVQQKRVLVQCDRCIRMTAIKTRWLKVRQSR